MVPHLVFVSIFPWIYSHLVPVEEIPPILFQTIKFNSQLGFIATTLIVPCFLLYERYHYSCVKGREAEMRLAGLADAMRDDFAYRSFRRNWTDYFLFPWAFVMLGSLPAITSQVGQFWSRSYTYTPSKKPLRAREDRLKDICNSGG
jgi:hypothetical protein